MISDGTYLYALGNDGELSSISVHLRGSRAQLKAQIEKEQSKVDKVKDDILHNDG
jgi:hypothetical protein